MINFNPKHDNINQIATLSKLVGVETKHEYRVYGLAQEKNPPILFSAQEGCISSEQEKIISSFLGTNGIDSATEDVEANNKKIYIGFRRDMRDNPEVVARLLETFVYYLEGTIDIPTDVKVGIPSFKNA